VWEQSSPFVEHEIFHQVKTIAGAAADTLLPLVLEWMKPHCSNHKNDQSVYVSLSQLFCYVARATALHRVTIEDTLTTIDYLGEHPPEGYTWEPLTAPGVILHPDGDVHDWTADEVIELRSQPWIPGSQARRGALPAAPTASCSPSAAARAAPSSTTTAAGTCQPNAHAAKRSTP
jgi:hypothetical protein